MRQTKRSDPREARSCFFFFSLSPYTSYLAVKRGREFKKDKVVDGSNGHRCVHAALSRPEGKIEKNGVRDSYLVSGNRWLCSLAKSRRGGNADEHTRAPRSTHLRRREYRRRVNIERNNHQTCGPRCSCGRSPSCFYQHPER